MKTASGTDARFWDRKAAGYARRSVPDEAAYQVTLDRVAAHLTPGAHVLEIGCGTGTTALKLARHVKAIVASDLSGEMIAIAKQKARTQGIDNVHFCVGTLKAGLAAREPFDTVMAFNLIHLLVDVPGALHRVRELVKPGGLFISKTPCVGEYGIVLRSVIPVLKAFGQAPFVNFIKQDALQAEITRAGFEILETGLYPAKRHSLFVVARRRTDG